MINCRLSDNALSNCITNRLQLCHQSAATVTPRFNIKYFIILLQTNKIFYIIYDSFLEMSDKLFTTLHLICVDFYAVNSDTNGLQINTYYALKLDTSILVYYDVKSDTNGLQINTYYALNTDDTLPTLCQHFDTTLSPRFNITLYSYKLTKYSISFITHF
jgi:hypothetical protein